jgi:mxaJ protein
MCSRFLRLLLFLCGAAWALGVQAGELRVCAEPDNLPYSHADRTGFENRIAELLAAELGVELRTLWHPQRRAFVRKTLGEGLCDAWIGVPSDFERTLNTRPYYRSSYVFVSASGIASFDDARLKALKVGVLLPGDDLAATPAGHALAAKGAVQNVVGFTVYGERPAAQRIVDAIARGELGAAVLWGPQAGYFAAKHELQVRRAQAPPDVPLPFEFAISVGVKRGSKALREALDAALERRRGDIDAILDAYAVPRL